MRSLLSIGLFLSLFLAPCFADERPSPVIQLSTTVEVTGLSGLIPELGEEFTPSIGSGLARLSSDVLIGLTDGGPKIDLSCKRGKVCKGERYGAPNFSPGIVRVESSSSKYRAVRYTPLFERNKGKLIYASGIQDGCKGQSSRLRIDPESIAAADGNLLWIGEEYGPSLLKVDLPTGQVLKRYRPGKGISKRFKEIYAKRGFEGLSLSKDGAVWMATQAVLDLDGKSHKSASFIRIIRFSPTEESSRSFAYSLLHVPQSYRDEVKLAALEILPNGSLLVLERVPSKAGERYFLVEIDPSSVPPLPEPERKKDELEFETDLSKVNPFFLKTVGRTELLFAEELEKLEGLEYLAETDTLLLSVDNDFGVGEDNQCGKALRSTHFFVIPQFLQKRDS